MSVLIKGMEMPTDCTECWFRKTARHEYLSDAQRCPFTGEITPYTRRKDDCPLVPVPAYGRLLIRDGEYICAEELPDIDYAPTDIEAEEGE